MLSSQDAGWLCLMPDVSGRLRLSGLQLRDVQFLWQALRFGWMACSGGILSGGLSGDIEGWVFAHTGLGGLGAFNSGGFWNGRKLRPWWYLQGETVCRANCAH